MIYLLTLMPFFTVFHFENIIITIIEIMIDIYFIFDILFNFNLAIPKEDGTYIEDRK